MLDILMLAVGLAALIGGAWLVVHGASRLALRFGVSPALVGATVVAFGTSAPEFLVSVLASAEGASGLAVGNVIGSNVANVALVLGLGAVLGTLRVRRQLLQWELPVLGVATALVVLFSGGERINRIEGAALFTILIVFVAGSARMGMDAFREAGDELEAPETTDGGSRLHDIAAVVGGVVLLAAGAELLVRGATGIAETLEISELVVGAVIVAVGTSLPEVATTVVAALRGEHEIAVGNAIGSNIFNAAGVLGLAAVVAPLDVDADLFAFELPAFAIATIVLIPLARREEVRRVDGLMLLFAYAAFVLGALARA